MLNKDLTRFMQYNKIEQAIERRCWQGVASSEYIGNQIKFNKYYGKELSPKTLVPHVFHTFFAQDPSGSPFFVSKTMLVNPSKNRVLISLYALVYKKKTSEFEKLITDSVTMTKFQGDFRLLN